MQSRMASYTSAHLILYFLFFTSGVSALIYQVIWQRMLFGVFGIDLTSTSIIISVFMFGLGIGALLGGYLADMMPKRLLLLYIIIELMIGLFGIVSPFMINGLGSILFTNNELVTGLACFIILAIPTILMGATFPILVTHVNQTLQHIGNSVGSLYFANTLGGAAGAYLASFVLLYTLNMTGAIHYAANLNFAIALIAFMMFRRRS